MRTVNYSFLDRLLHRMALEYSSVAEMSFDLDQVRARVDAADVASRVHVFVSGLARAGTTVLMRQFHATGLYRSLTYRDMPFILAPNQWRRFTAGSKQAAADVERAHGDNVLVSLDSPESFDEVFWRVFCGPEYIRKSRLQPHGPPREVIDKYVRYVGALLADERLYLCKNNNNILRLGAIRDAFPNALILIPFRDPVQHAASLLRQHLRFSEMQREDAFVKDYMRWLGHHEFGLDHRPFRFAGEQASRYATDSIDYWLELWCGVYEWLEQAAPESAVFVCYEDLCLNEAVWPALAAAAAIPRQHAGLPSFSLSRREEAMGEDRTLGKRAAAVYSRLAENGRLRLAA